MLEGFFSIGPMTATTRTSNRKLSQRIDFRGYEKSTLETVEMEGDGKGLALEFGGRVNLKIQKHVCLFLEGSYSHMVAKNLKGSRFSTMKSYDSNATIMEGQFSSVGDWALYQLDLQYPWGDLNQSQLVIDSTGDSQFSPFELDLSGFRFKIGIAYLF